MDGFEPAGLSSGRKSFLTLGYNADSGPVGSLMFEVPRETQKFDFIDAIIHIRRMKAEESVSWSPLDKSLNVTRKSGDYSFTLRRFSKSGDRIKTSCEMIIPERPKDAPDSEPINFVREVIRFTDGTTRERRGSKGEGNLSNHEWTHIGALVPASYSVHFPGEMAEEEYPFRLENVFIPALELDRTFSHRPEMEAQVSDKGISHKITGISSQDSSTGHSVSVTLEVKFSPAMNVIAVSHSVADADGFDDSGKSLVMLSRNWAGLNKLLNDTGMLSLQISPPAAKANRIAMLKGKYSYAVVTQYKSFHAAIPPIDAERPLQQTSGSVEFVSVYRRGDVVEVEYSLERKIGPEHEWKLIGMSSVLLDKNGKSLAPRRSMGTAGKDPNTILMQVDFRLNGFQPTQIEVKLPSEGRVETVEFGLIDIPLRPSAPAKQP